MGGNQQQQQFFWEMYGSISKARGTWRARGLWCEVQAAGALLRMDAAWREGDDKAAREHKAEAWAWCKKAEKAERLAVEVRFRVGVPGAGIPRSRSRCSTRSRERRSTRSCARSGDSGDDGEHEPAAHRAGGAS